MPPRQRLHFRSPLFVPPRRLHKATQFSAVQIENDGNLQQAAAAVAAADSGPWFEFSALWLHSNNCPWLLSQPGGCATQPTRRLPLPAKQRHPHWCATAEPLKWISGADLVKPRFVNYANFFPFFLFFSSLLNSPCDAFERNQMAESEIEHVAIKRNWANAAYT